MMQSMWPFKEETVEKQQLPVDGPWSVTEGRHGDAIMVIRTNTGYREYKRVPGYEYQVGIAVPLVDAEASGLPSSAESVSLTEIEESLCEALQEQCESLFVAVITTSGMREFVFYTRDPSSVESRLAKLRQKFASHELQLMIQLDKPWDIYSQLG